MPIRELAVVLASLLAACTTAEGPAPALSHADVPLGCALGVQGATVGPEETPDGIDLVFSAPGRTAEIRERANDAAAQHGPGQRMGLGHGGKHGHGGPHGLQMMQMPAARSAASDTPEGARIHFTPSDPKDLEALRSALRERALLMTTARCP